MLCYVFVLFSAFFVLPLPADLYSPPTQPLGHLHLLFNWIINVLNSRRENKAAIPFIYAFKLWVTLLLPQWLLQSHKSLPVG